MSGQTKPKACGGIFTVDADLPPDKDGRHVCVCGLVGRPGDARHRLPEAEGQRDVRRRYGDDE